MTKRLLILTDQYGVEFACFADTWRILPGTGGLLEITYNNQVTGLHEPWEYIGGIDDYNWIQSEPYDDMDMDNDLIPDTQSEWVN